MTLRILIADDNHDTVLSLSVLLRHLGHEVEGVHSGAEAFLALRRNRPDAILLDLEMPGMSGYAVAHEVRSFFGDAAPLLVAISGKWTGPSDQRLARELGFDHYLSKPADPKALLDLLKDAAVSGPA